MKNLSELDRYRVKNKKVLDLYGWYGDSFFGCFQVPSPYNARPLFIIAASGEGWDHVSVSKEKKCPTWGEMEFIKRLFFNHNEVAMQLHVPQEDHINVHPNCLHLWRPHDLVIPLPPKKFV